MAPLNDLDLEQYAGRGGWRRWLLACLVLATTGVGTWLMATLLGANGLTWAEFIVTAVFTLLFAWIAVSFWVAMIGFALLALELDPISLKRRRRLEPGLAPELMRRTAVLFPIYNEDTRRVFAGIAATYRSLAATSCSARFDVFVLSDTTESDVARRERVAWATTVQQLGAQGRIFYRHRERNLGRKSGNIADWIMRWGGAYEFMVVMDADSIMSGETLVQLAMLMEANPNTGAIQTFPIAVNRTTLFARALQFAHRLYGPGLAAGHSFWQLGEANYYGHNAILRTRAFAEACGLPHLPGHPPLGGELLSHDFVEAAFLRRNGWYVWFAATLRGSYEELPSNLVDYAIRDRRWAQGQMQHARVLVRARIRLISRLHLAMATFAFLASPLWLALLVLSSTLVAQHALQGHVFFPRAFQLFPVWPEYRPVESAWLLGTTGFLLLFPKILGVVHALSRRPLRAAYGGPGTLLLSAILELGLSILLAPILMLLHTSFVASILVGRAVGWKSQPRDDRGVTWQTAARVSFGHTIVGAVWIAITAAIAPNYLSWIAPVVAGLALSIPLIVFSSRTWDRRMFLLPEETQAPQVLQLLRAGTGSVAAG